MSAWQQHLIQRFHNMRIAKIISSAALAIAFCSVWALSPAGQSPSTPANSAAPFLGRWDLTLKAPDGEHFSWIEITEKGGKPAALFTGRWGNARPLPRIEIAGSELTFVSPKEE